MAPSLAQAVRSSPAGEERRHEAEQEARARGQGQREPQDRLVEGHLVQARNGNAIGDQDDEPAMEREGKRKACGAAGQRQQQALGEHLRDQPATADLISSTISS